MNLYVELMHLDKECDVLGVSNQGNLFFHLLPTFRLPVIFNLINQVYLYFILFVLFSFRKQK